MAYLLSLLAMFGGHAHFSHAEGARAFAAGSARAVPSSTRHADFARAFAAGSARAIPVNARHAQSLRAFAA